MPSNTQDPTNTAPAAGDPATGATGTQPAAAAADPSAATASTNTTTAADDDSDVFDKDRAMRTIKALRSEVKDLEKFRKVEEDRRRKEMSDLERAQVEAKDIKAQLEAANRQLHSLMMREAFFSEVEKQELVFASDTARADAFVLADFSETEVTDGAVKGIDKVVKALAKSKGYLFSGQSSQRPAQRPPNINAADGGTAPAGGAALDETRKRLLRTGKYA